MKTRASAQMMHATDTEWRLRPQSHRRGDGARPEQGRAPGGGEAGGVVSGQRCRGGNGRRFSDAPEGKVGTEPAGAPRGREGQVGQSQWVWVWRERQDEGENSEGCVSPRRNEAQSSPTGKSEGPVKGPTLAQSLEAAGCGWEGRDWVFPSKRVILMLERVAHGTSGREEPEPGSRGIWPGVLRGPLAPRPCGATERVAEMRQERRAWRWGTSEARARSPPPPP